MPNARKILIVDDDPQLRDALTEQLSLHEEFEAAAAENGIKGVQVAKEGRIDLVIMDVGWPDIDGREAVRILRRNGFKAPIIMLTGHDADSDTILGLESGEPTIMSPSPSALPCCLRASAPQLRQHEASEDAIFAIGPFTFLARVEAAAQSGGQQTPLDGEGDLDPTVPLSRRRACQHRARDFSCKRVWGYNSRRSPRTRSRHTSIG